jgi:hypothetical protein
MRTIVALNAESVEKRSILWVASFHQSANDSRDRVNSSTKPRIKGGRL